MTAAERWAEQLGRWAIPDDILSAAPESPWGFPPALFRAHTEGETPSLLRAREALPDGGSVLDVGAGGGAGSIPLAPPAGRLVAVDESSAMLAEYARAADERRVAHAEVEGRWPDVADQVGEADVVVCHHVLYNVADVVPFVRALTERADRRVVVELTAVHPLVGLNPLWRHFHDLDRPEGPSADDAVEVLREQGVDVHVERYERAPRSGHDPGEYVAFTRRRLCLPPEREPEVARLLPPPAPRGVVTLWWEPSPAVHDRAGQR